GAGAHLVDVLVVDHRDVPSGEPLGQALGAGVDAHRSLHRGAVGHGRGRRVSGQAHGGPIVPRFAGDAPVTGRGASMPSSTPVTAGTGSAAVITSPGR